MELPVLQNNTVTDVLIPRVSRREIVFHFTPVEVQYITTTSTVHTVHLKYLSVN